MRRDEENNIEFVRLIIDYANKNNILCYFEIE